jgi:pyrimidine deaminase RibD-like protein
MSATNSVVAVFDTHELAEKGVKALQQAGIEMKCRLRQVSR